MDQTPPTLTPPKRHGTDRNVFVRSGQWLRAKPYRIYVLVGVVLVAGAGGTAYYLVSRPLPPLPAIVIPTPKPKPKPVVYYSPLTGEKVSSEALTERPVTAIMIENSIPARPQSGLKQAGVVYEAVAEGGITRFLALYQEAQPTLIGPVRSIRMYYVDWLAPYDPGIIHVGGAADALSEVRNGSYRDLDQFFNSSAYWRSTDRYAPHNVYTSFKRINALEKSKGITSSSFSGFPRADGEASDKPDATSIAINFSGPLYNTKYTYSAKTNTYARSVGGSKSMDREKGQITPTVVIAMKVNMALASNHYRENIQTTGSGTAYIFQNGTVTKATWRKKSRTSQLQFVDKAGATIDLDRGQTWIAAVPNSSGSVSWQ